MHVHLLVCLRGCSGCAWVLMCSRVRASVPVLMCLCSWFLEVYLCVFMCLLTCVYVVLCACLCLCAFVLDSLLHTTIWFIRTARQPAVTEAWKRNRRYQRCESNISMRVRAYPHRRILIAVMMMFMRSCIECLYISISQKKYTLTQSTDTSIPEQRRKTKNMKLIKVTRSIASYVDKCVWHVPCLNAFGKHPLTWYMKFQISILYVRVYLWVVDKILKYNMSVKNNNNDSTVA